MCTHTHTHVAFLQVNEKLKSTDEAVVAVEAMQGKMDERNVSFNPHTLMTAVDTRLMWKTYQSFLGVKKANIDEEIKGKKMRGMSQAQYDELEKMFKQFDTSKDGHLDKNEFKACLYSLGEERGSKEVKEIMGKFSTGDGDKGINYEGFMEFMITELGDTDTANEIIHAFALINGDVSAAQTKLDQMNAAEKAKMEEQMAALAKVNTHAHTYTQRHTYMHAQHTHARTHTHIHRCASWRPSRRSWRARRSTLSRARTPLTVECSTTSGLPPSSPAKLCSQTRTVPL